jgi:hypothetical protein
MEFYNRIDNKVMRVTGGGRQDIGVLGAEYILLQTGVPDCYAQR